MSEEAAQGAAPQEGRVRVSVPEAYKPVSDEVWSDLESYLYQGFLTCSAKLLGKTFVFKTLNHHELRYLRYLRPSGITAQEALERHRAAFVAHSVFMIDGENFLPGRHRQTARLSKLVMKMGGQPLDVILSNLAAVNERASRLHPLTEVYVHENRSRYRWMHTCGTPVHAPVNTGVAGTDEVGMNYCQQAWTTLNRLMDSREQMEREWTNAKFVGSCFAGKGVRAIDERDRARAAREKSELDDLRMKVLHGYLNRTAGKGEEPTVTLPDGRRAVVAARFRAESAQELADQMSAYLSGEKDHHDLVVDLQMQRAREHAATMEQSRQAMYRVPASAASVVGGGSRVLGGREEADALLDRIRGLRDQQMSDHNRAKVLPSDGESSDDGVNGGD